MILGHFVQTLAWLMLLPILSAGSRSLDLWWPQAVSIAINTAIFAWMQSAGLKRLAPGWMKRLHDGTRKGACEGGPVGRDLATGTEAGTGS